MRLPYVLACLLFGTVCYAGSDFETTVTTVESRGVLVPVTFVHPAGTPERKVPVVVMVHGHGGNREEAGGFTRLAARLAESGIASIRMDMPGCGDSSEAFTENTIANMLADVRAATSLALAHPGTDPARAGILGFSMGGRIAMLAAADGGYASMVLWNPVGTNGSGSMVPLLGGAHEYVRLRDTALEAGAVDFTTPWGQEQRLSGQWFEQLENSTPLTEVGRFIGPLLLVTAEQDEIIDPMVSAAVAKAARHADVTVFRVADGDHGLGFYSGKENVSNEVISATARFIQEQL